MRLECFCRVGRNLAVASFFLEAVVVRGTSTYVVVVAPAPVGRTVGGFVGATGIEQ